MGITIQNSSAGGGSQDLQTVLNNGNFLTQNNAIFGNLNNLKFTDNQIFSIFSNNINIGSAIEDNFINIQSQSRFDVGLNTNFVFQLDYSAIANNVRYRIYDNANSIDNIFYLDSADIKLRFGDYRALVNGTYIQIDDSQEDIRLRTNYSIVNVCNLFEITEASSGAGIISIAGLGYVSASAPATPRGHLKLTVNGQIRYIAITG